MVNISCWLFRNMSLVSTYIPHIAFIYRYLNCWLKHMLHQISYCLLNGYDKSPQQSVAILPFVVMLRECYRRFQRISGTSYLHFPHSINWLKDFWISPGLMICFTNSFSKRHQSYNLVFLNSCNDHLRITIII